MPAAIPPKTRAAKSTVSDGANAASRHAGTDSTIPSTRSSFRP